MTATSAPSAAPSHAVRCWTDSNNLFFELPSHNGPCVLGFPRSALGFTKALAVLFVRHETEGHGEVYLRPPALLAANPTPDKDGITAAQRQEARDLLKRMKIL